MNCSGEGRVSTEGVLVSTTTLRFHRALDAGEPVFSIACGIRPPECSVRVSQSAGSRASAKLACPARDVRDVSVAAHLLVAEAISNGRRQVGT